MFAICIESSHKRGMGHFYRALNILEFLEAVGEQAVVVVNEDKVSADILSERKILYETVDYSDTKSNWEKNIIDKYKITVWLLDKFETGMELAAHVKGAGIVLAAIDDCGKGAEIVDLHFCAMLFHDQKGRNIYSGKEYLVLSKEIKKYRRQRTELKRIVVSLGGSDTYGVTVKIVQILKEKGICADIITGPNFQHKGELQKETGDHFVIYENVPSLIAKFAEYDLAITGGGVTGFEANASGLPCIIIANELHEIEIGKYLENHGGAKFAGYYECITEKDLNIGQLDIEDMSRAALSQFHLNGMDNIYQIIKAYMAKVMSYTTR